MFLVDRYPDPGPLASETSNQMIQFNLFRFLSAKNAAPFAQKKKTAENSIRMVNPLGLHALQYANELLVLVKLCFKNFSNLPKQEETITNYQKQVLVMIKLCLRDFHISSIPE